MRATRANAREPRSKPLGVGEPATEADVAVRAHRQQTTPRLARNPVDSDARFEGLAFKIVGIARQKDMRPRPCEQSVQPHAPPVHSHTGIRQPVSRPSPGKQSRRQVH